MEKNKIVEIPYNIGNLNKLIYLSIKYNLLSSLPDSIGSLISLKGFDVSYNKLTTIPKLDKLQNLVMLSLSNNPLKNKTKIKNEYKRFFY